MLSVVPSIPLLQDTNQNSASKGTLTAASSPRLSASPSCAHHVQDTNQNSGTVAASSPPLSVSPMHTHRVHHIAETGPAVASCPSTFRNAPNLDSRETAKAIGKFTCVWSPQTIVDGEQATNDDGRHPQVTRQLSAREMTHLPRALTADQFGTKLTGSKHHPCEVHRWSSQPGKFPGTLPLEARQQFERMQTPNPINRRSTIGSGPQVPNQHISQIRQRNTIGYESRGRPATVLGRQVRATCSPPQSPQFEATSGLQSQIGLQTVGINGVHNPMASPISMRR